MNHKNAEDKPAKKSWDGFPCDLFRSLEPNNRADSLPLDFESFESWLDGELHALEKKFAHNVTVNSQRNDVKSSR